MSCLLRCPHLGGVLPGGAALCYSIFVAVKPQIVLYPNISEFFAGSTLLLSCVGYGIPLPHVVWSKDGLSLQTAAINDSRISTWDETVVVDRDRDRHMFTQSYLRICSTTKMDSGLYNCSAVTDEEKNEVQFGVRVVEVPPVFLRTPGICILMWYTSLMKRVFFLNFRGC